MRILPFSRRRSYDPAGIDAVDAALLEIARKIRNQYTLAYAVRVDQHAARVEEDGLNRHAFSLHLSES